MPGICNGNPLRLGFRWKVVIPVKGYLPDRKIRPERMYAQLGDSEKRTRYPHLSQTPARHAGIILRHFQQDVIGVTNNTPVLLGIR